MIGEFMNLFYSKIWMKIIGIADEFCAAENEFIIDFSVLNSSYGDLVLFEAF